MKYIRYQSETGPQVGMYTDEAEVKQAAGSIADGFRASDSVGTLESLHLLAPLEPGKVVAIGLNYVAHVTEMDKTRELPEFPVMFMKPNSAIIGPGENIRLANPENDTHYEAELCVVIGKTATDVDEANALDYVFGYTCGNDVSDRAVQYARGQWIQGKGYDSYCPLGPCIETDLDVSNVRVQSRLNSEPRQDETTDKLIFNIPHLISYISKVMTLFPGDVIMTGTPHGVGPMKAGDTIEIEVEGIGVLRNPVVNRYQ
jgi:2-keto-4-pentenoate hydratase/2-oxohepta-3-ene-1,7-dioic acid hydratase in catechol pathway